MVKRYNERVHIAEIEVKTPENIVNELSVRDAYSENIWNAAMALIKIGYGYNAKYQTQWASGTTLWLGPDGDTFTVSRTGLLERR